MDLLLTGGLVYDGTGRPAERRDVGIAAGRIVLDPDTIAAAGSDGVAGSGAGPQVRDVTGLAICPGFVDIHTHSDLTLLSNPLGDSKIRQGVTTEVVGNCGLGVTPLPSSTPAGSPSGVSTAAVRAAAGYLDLDPEVQLDWTDFGGYLDAVRRAHTAMNVAAFVPHLPVHAAVVGLDDTTANDRQLTQMAELVDAALQAGAVGLSTGLMYAPLCYVDERELMALGAAVARRGKLFAWHVADYADDLVPAVQQAVRVAMATGCRTQISHLQVVGRRNWGTVNTALAEIDRARAAGVDVAADIYPYLAGNAPLSQLLPYWAQEGGSAQFAPRLRVPEVRHRVLDEWADSHRTWDDIVVDGSSVAALAEAAGTSPGEMALDLLADRGGAVNMTAFGRSEDDLATVLSHPATVVASDGQALDPHGVTGAAGVPHPRSYGCFPRYLSRYAGDPADGIRRCTSAPADRVGLADRGRIADGSPADLVLLDLARLADTATFEDPQCFPKGVAAVIVGGQVVIDDGADTGARPGNVLSTLSTTGPTHHQPHQ